MKRNIIALLALGLSLTAAVPAFADANEGNKPTFPMKADEFKAHVEQRLAKKKEHLEKRITEKKVDAAQAKEMRERFEARAAKVRAAVAAASQDGVVTKEEAKAIRQANGHHGHHGHRGNKDASKAKQ